MNIDQARYNMVEQQIRPWRVLDNKILDLLFNLKREEFISEKYKNLAFSDLEIPLPGAQKMLLPKIEARLVQELEISSEDKVLEIGTGSGYVTAMLAKLANFVYSVEIDETNKQFAEDNLTKAGINNVSIILGNGRDGFKSKAPYNKIFIGAGLVAITDSIKEQIAIGGKLVGFIGELPVMHGVLIERIGEGDFKQTKLFETGVDYLISEEIKHFKF